MSKKLTTAEMGRMNVAQYREAAKLPLVVVLDLQFTQYSMYGTLLEKERDFQREMLSQQSKEPTKKSIMSTKTYLRLILTRI